jgi:hypothetical protein
MILVKGTFFSYHEIMLILSTFRRSKRLPAEELANESRSTHITVSADMVFSLSNQLSGVSLGLSSRTCF